MQSWSWFKVWMKQIFFDKKDFIGTVIVTIIPFIHPIKTLEEQALNTVIHFYLCYQTFLCILTITSTRYYVYKLPGKVENSPFSTQICLKNRFRFGISEN